MNDFYHSASPRQSALLIFVFLSMVLCLGIGFACRYSEKTKRLRFLNAVVFAVLFILEAVMGHSFWQMREDLYFREILRVPMWGLWCIACAALMLLIYETVVLIRRGKRELHKDSVKQAIDTLPGGICYFTHDGAVKLCNLQMHRLFRTLAQSDLQSLEELHSALKNCNGSTGVLMLSGELQAYLFPNGKAWRYSENEVTAPDGVTYTEAMFIDITELYEDSIKLKEQTKRLEQIANELKLLSYNVQSAAKEQEVLSAKTALHDQMGAGVLAVRRILKSGQTEQAAYGVELFRKAVRMLKNDNDSFVGRSEFDEFIHDAETIGVNVKFYGELPKAEERSHAFILAMRECLTNGVRHAHADEITVSVTENENTLTLKITNNGDVPKSPVVPKGGLKNLERYVMNLNGTVNIQSFPEFMLTVSFAKEEAK